MSFLTSFFVKPDLAKATIAKKPTKTVKATKESTQPPPKKSKPTPPGKAAKKKTSPKASKPKSPASAKKVSKNDKPMPKEVRDILETSDKIIKSPKGSRVTRSTASKASEKGNKGKRKSVAGEKKLFTNVEEVEEEEVGDDKTPTDYGSSEDEDEE